MIQEFNLVAGKKGQDLDVGIGKNAPGRIIEVGYVLVGRQCIETNFDDFVKSP